ncbi:MAG: hypothetical protein JSC085_000609 [Candidatus Tokpelaia sp. JSC085]|nr:MAG: hypothetical protein JSC085_000609 [Candidatus Tokpelaia sp. JSC085]
MQKYKNKVNASSYYSPFYNFFSKHALSGILFLLFCLMLFGIGFIIFNEKVYRLQVPATSQVADAIVVLTGGRARLETGLNLLENGKGKRLLISGVNPMARRYVLMQSMHADPDLFQCCVDLGRQAINTVGNAEESARWVEENGYQTVFIVTNSYHMPRSLIEFKRKMPYTDLIPYPVKQISSNGGSVFYLFAHLRTLLVEYMKYLSAYARSFIV